MKSKKNILLVGNCQISGIKGCLDLMADVNVEVHRYTQLLHFHRGGSAETEWRDSLIEKAEQAEQIFVMTQFKDNLLQYCEQFKEKIELIPYIRSETFHPDITPCVTTDGNRVQTLMYTHNSALILFGFQNGLSVDETVSLFCEGVFEHLGYFDCWFKSQIWADSEEQLTGWPVRRWYQDWIKDGTFVHTVNHPNLRVYAELSRYMLERLSIKPELIEPEKEIADPGTRFTVWPVYPEIAERLGFQGSYEFKIPQSYRNKFNNGKVSISLREFVEDCFDKYSTIGQKNIKKSKINREPYTSLKDSLAFNVALNDSNSGPTHPYRDLPDYRFWRRSVSKLEMKEIDPVVRADFPILKTHRVATAGSCFAQELARTLKQHGFNYFVTEFAPEELPQEEVKRRNFNVYSARYGNIYTTRHLMQLMDRIDGSFIPVDNAWQREDGRFVDPFRPLIEPGGFATIRELEESRRLHLDCVLEMFENLDVFLFTLGLTEAWRSKIDGAVFPLAPGVSGGEMDDEKYEFVNLTSQMVIEDLERFTTRLFEINPTAKVIFTVSPVPMIATFEDRHVISSTTYSKSVLRVAAEEVSRENPNIAYFPSYEVVTSNFSRGNYYAEDLRSVTEEGITHVMRLLIQHYMIDTDEFIHLEEEDIICDEDIIDELSGFSDNVYTTKIESPTTEAMKVLKNYLKTPELFNINTRQKNKLKSRLKLQMESTSIDTHIDWISEMAVQRTINESKNVFILNAGSSGSNWILKMLNEIPEISSIDEVYIAEELRNKISDFNDFDRKFILNGIHLAHLRKLDHRCINQIIINSAQTPSIAIHRNLDSDSICMFLKRDPKNIVISRTFRKNEYKQHIAANRSTLEYLKQNINFVNRHYEALKEASFDFEFSYEEAIADPSGTITSILDAIGVEFDRSKLVEIIESHDSRIILAGDKSINSNSFSEMEEVVGEEELKIISTELDKIRIKMNYLDSKEDSPSGHSCCVCETPVFEFKEDNGIPSRKCPGCGSIERTRGALSWIGENIDLKGLDIFSVSPSGATTSFIQKAKPRSFSRCDIRPINDYEIQADITNMPEVGSESYDLAIVVKVLEHCNDDIAAMAELHRILKPGGRLIIVGDITKDYPTRQVDDPTSWYGEKNLKEFNIGTFRKYGLLDLEQELKVHFDVKVHTVRDIPTAYEGLLIECIRHSEKPDTLEGERMSGKYVLITIDTEAQPTRQSADHVNRLIYCETEHGDYGISEMMDIADDCSVKLSFFVDIISDIIYPKEIKKVCQNICERGHDVQLHAHPEYVPLDFWNALMIPRGGLMNRWTREQSDKVLRWMIARCEEWGVPRPVAIRGGGYRYNANLLMSASELGINLDLSYNHLHHKFPLTETSQPQPFNFGPLPLFQWGNGMLEVPISTIQMNGNSVKHESRRRFDGNFVQAFASDVYERIDGFFSETKGPAVLVMMMHSWSFLGFDKETGFYTYQGKKKRDSFESFLKNLPADYEVITASQLNEKWINGEIKTSMTLDITLASHE